MSNGDEGVPLGCTDLLQGWTAHWSTRHPSRLFYHNAETGDSKWKLPVSSTTVPAGSPAAESSTAAPDGSKSPAGSNSPAGSKSSTMLLQQTDRCFHVDVLQSVKRLGLRLEPGTDENARQWLKIVEVMDESVMQDWNARCAATFPPDQLRPGDKIVWVNRQTDIGAMEKALALEERILMVVLRSEIQ